jgi:hypothetical protein
MNVLDPTKYPEFNFWDVASVTDFPLIEIRFVGAVLFDGELAVCLIPITNGVAS